MKGIIGLSGTIGSPFLKVILAPVVGGVIFSYIIDKFQIEEVHRVTNAQIHKIRSLN
jgi:hypothetical protein